MFIYFYTWFSAHDVHRTPFTIILLSHCLYNFNVFDCKMKQFFQNRFFYFSFIYCILEQGNILHFIQYNVKWLFDCLLFRIPCSIPTSLYTYLFNCILFLLVIISDLLYYHTSFLEFLLYHIYFLNLMFSIK